MGFQDLMMRRMMRSEAKLLMPEGRRNLGSCGKDVGTLSVERKRKDGGRGRWDRRDFR